jgi:hypothetical protein
VLSLPSDRNDTPEHQRPHTVRHDFACGERFRTSCCGPKFGEGYPAPVANAVNILQAALAATSSAAPEPSLDVAQAAAAKWNEALATRDQTKAWQAGNEMMLAISRLLNAEPDHD